MRATSYTEAAQQRKAGRFNRVQKFLSEDAEHGPFVTGLTGRDGDLLRGAGANTTRLTVELAEICHVLGH